MKEPPPPPVHRMCSSLQRQSSSCGLRQTQSRSPVGGDFTPRAFLRQKVEDIADRDGQAGCRLLGGAPLIVNKSPGFSPIYQLFCRAHGRQIK
jgi:hypothetical protein